MKRSMKMMWGCVALVVLIVILATAGLGIAVAGLFVIPCMLMMGAMIWMMMRGMGGGSRSDSSK